MALKKSIRGETRKATHDPRCCAGCGEPSGSISEGTGFPLVRDKESGGVRTTSAAYRGTRSSTRSGVVWRGWGREGGPVLRAEIMARVQLVPGCPRHRR